MDIDPFRGYPSKNQLLVLGLAGVLALGGCGKPVSELGTTTASQAPYNTAPGNISPTVPTPNDLCADLQSYDVVTDADGANRYMTTIPKTCQDKAIDIFDEQGAPTGQIPSSTEFDIICSAAAAKVNPTFKIHLDNPERYERVHLSPILAAQEATDYTIPTC